jgi:GT2 family glycosyltransferase
MQVSLIITTYNWPEALEACVKRLQLQTRLPEEVLIADDGSGASTRTCIEGLQASSPFPIRHIWQEDRGFRAAEARNRAMAASEGDYLILIDGDILCHRHFVADHLAFARRGRWIQGGRVFLDATCSQKRIEEPTPSSLPFYLPGMSNRKNAIRHPFLAGMASREIFSFKSIHSANMSLWREDALRTNGFDQRYQGWGLEDSDFAVRLQHAGLARFNLRHMALVYHLHHPTRCRGSLPENQQRFEETIRRGEYRCEEGIDRHLPLSERPVVSFHCRKCG